MPYGRADRGPFSKAELIGRIEALGAPDADDEANEPAEAVTDDRGQTIGALVAELLADPDLGYAEIVAVVRGRFPKARTTARSVASVASTMRRMGVDVPKRGRKGAAQSTGSWRSGA